MTTAQLASLPEIDLDETALTDRDDRVRDTIATLLLGMIEDEERLAEEIADLRRCRAQMIEALRRGEYYRLDGIAKTDDVESLCEVSPEPAAFLAEILDRINTIGF